jgi:hypothetical protein
VKLSEGGVETDDFPFEVNEATLDRRHRRAIAGT